MDFKIIDDLKEIKRYLKNNMKPAIDQAINLAEKY